MVPAGGAMLWCVQRSLREGALHNADFFDFYWAADAMRRGLNPYASGDGGYIYPTWLAFVLQPLSLVGPNAAARVWTFVNLLLLIACTWFGSRQAERAWPDPSDGARSPADRAAATLAVSSIAFLLLADSFRSEFEWNNCNLLLIACLVIAVPRIGAQPVAAGVALGLACAIKYLPVVFLPYLLVRGHWKAALAMFGTLLAVLLLPALQVGWSTHLDHIRIAFSGMRSMQQGKTSQELVGSVARVEAVHHGYSISITSGIARALRESGQGLGALWPVTALAASVALAGTWAIYLAKRVPLLRASPADGPRTPAIGARVRLVECAGLMVAALAFSPQTQKRHLNLLLPFACVLGAMALRGSRRERRLAFLAIGIVALLATPMPNVWREFIDQVWKHRGGPGWAIIAAWWIVLWSTLASSPPASTAREHA
jgi:hypothetical protein